MIPIWMLSVFGIEVEGGLGFRELEAAGRAQRGGALRRWAGEGWGGWGEIMEDYA